MNNSVSTSNDLFDEDSAEESVQSQSEELSEDSTQSNEPVPFLASLSVKSQKFLGVPSENGESGNPAVDSERGELVNENVLQEVYSRASHRRMLSFTPINSSCSQSASSLRGRAESDSSTGNDPKGETLEIKLPAESAGLPPSAGSSQKISPPPTGSSQRISPPPKGKLQSDLFEKDGGMEMARSYINIHESRRAFENHLHSQRKKQQSDEARLQAYMLLNVFLNRRDQNKDRFPRNVFITSKYTPWNFIFINLFEQFSRVANFVFLLVTLVQLIPGVSPFNIWSTLLPLIFILLVTAIKEAWEDYLRHKADKITNNVMYKRILPDGSMQPIPSCEIVSGDVIVLEDQEAIPADILVLACSDSDGTCYVDTSSLDGETK